MTALDPDTIRRAICCPDGRCRGESRGREIVCQAGAYDAEAAAVIAAIEKAQPAERISG